MLSERYLESSPVVVNVGKEMCEHSIVRVGMIVS